MSMLSSKCDRLRETADKLDEFGKTLWRGRDVLDDATRELRDAADTIWELRCKLADVVDQREEIERLKAENAKLWELLRNALTYIEYEGCGVECPETGNSATLTSCDTCNRYETESCAYVIAQSARELGIEVGK